MPKFKAFSLFIRARDYTSITSSRLTHQFKRTNRGLRRLGDTRVVANDVLNKDHTASGTFGHIGAFADAQAVSLACAAGACMYTSPSKKNRNQVVQKIVKEFLTAEIELK